MVGEQSPAVSTNVNLEFAGILGFRPAVVEGIRSLHDVDVVRVHELLIPDTRTENLVDLHGEVSGELRLDLQGASIPVPDEVRVGHHLRSSDDLGGHLLLCRGVDCQRHEVRHRRLVASTRDEQSCHDGEECYPNQRHVLRPATHDQPRFKR